MPRTDPAILRRFYTAVPRHTAYPSPDRFVEAFGPEEHASWMRKRGIGGFGHTLALYGHIPFGGTSCPQCGRLTDVALDRLATEHYLAAFEKELQLQSGCLEERGIVHLHLGGDTAALLHDGVLPAVSSWLCEYFVHTGRTRCSLDVDPLAMQPRWLAEIVASGFDQLCLSICPCQAGEQCAAAPHRLLDGVEALVTAAREHGITSIMTNVVFGSPGQTVMSFNQTLKRVLSLSPDRIALRDDPQSALAPRPPRKRIEADAFAEETRVQLFDVALMRLSQAGYVHVGMNQFARPDDSLVVAQRQGRLHRNLQGYCTDAACDVLGVGLGSISSMGPVYSQNARSLADYQELLDASTLPVTRGIELNSDDLARRTIMDALMCHFEVAFEAVEIAHLLDFRRYFSDELEDLKVFAGAGLVEMDDDWLYVTERGRCVVWTICQVFDRYQREQRKRAASKKVL